MERMIVTPAIAGEALADSDKVIVAVRDEVKAMTFVEYADTYNAIMLASRSDMKAWKTIFESDPERTAEAITRYNKMIGRI